MSILKYLFYALLIMDCSCWGARALTLVAGDILQGTIVDYKVGNDMLTFRSDDGKQTRIRGDQLDDESFKYVRSWAAAEAFDGSYAISGFMYMVQTK